MDCLDRGLLGAMSSLTSGNSSPETVHDQTPVHGQRRRLQATLKSKDVTPTTPKKEVKQGSPKKGSKCLKRSVEHVATSSSPLADQAAQDVTTPTDQATQDVATPPPKKKHRRRPFKDIWDEHGKRWANQAAETHEPVAVDDNFNNNTSDHSSPPGPCSPHQQQRGGCTVDAQELGEGTENKLSMDTFSELDLDDEIPFQTSKDKALHPFGIRRVPNSEVR